MIESGYFEIASNWDLTIKTTNIHARHHFDVVPIKCILKLRTKGEFCSAKRI